MNIIAPAFSTNFTKSLNKSIDRTAGMLYNNSVSDSFTFGSARNKRYEKLSHNEFQVWDSSSKNEKEETTLKDIISKLENSLNKKDNEYKLIIKSILNDIKFNFNKDTIKTSNDIRFMNDLVYLLYEGYDRKDITKILDNYKKNI